MTLLNWIMWFGMGVLTALTFLGLFSSTQSGIIAATVIFAVFAILGGLDYMGSREPKRSSR